MPGNVTARGPPADSQRRPGAALAAALCSAAETEYSNQAKLKLDFAPKRSLAENQVIDADDGANTERSSVPLAMRRLEQRIEAERRHVDRQIQRLERRVEEVACTATAGGCWAELQGYVDGLSETVQGLVRRSEGSAVNSDDVKGSCGTNGTSRSLGQHAEVDAATSARIASLEKRMHQLEAPGGQLQELTSLAREASEQTAELKSKMLQVGTRLVQAERALESLEGQPREARQDVEPLRAELFDGEIQHFLEGIADQIGSFGARLQRAEQAIEASATLDDLGRIQDEVTNLNQQASGRREVQFGDDLDLAGGMERSQDVELREQLHEAYDLIEVLRGDFEEHAVILQDQVAELGSRFQDLESGLQDVAEAQESKQQVDHVGERALRLALRAQRAAHGGLAGDDARELRGELSSVGEELASVWSRVEGAECGLDGMTEALSRVCEELAQLRATHPSARDARRLPEGAEKAATVVQQDPAPVRNSAATEVSRLVHKDDERQTKIQSLGAEEEESQLRDKVEELERSLESMAEVVWDLRKQVSSIRGRPGAVTALAEADQHSNSEISDA